MPKNTNIFLVTANIASCFDQVSHHYNLLLSHPYIIIDKIAFCDGTMMVIIKSEASTFFFSILE